MSETNGSAIAQEFTPTQRRFLALLGDGAQHNIDLFVPMLNDRDGEKHVVRDRVREHVRALNRKLARQGQCVVLERREWKTYLRQVSLLRSE